MRVAAHAAHKPAASEMVAQQQQVDGRVREFAPPRFDAEDRSGIRSYLAEHGFACVRGCVTPGELQHAHDLLWNHLEGVEEATQRMTQRRPMGWRREQPQTWLEGHGDALMTSTTHCESMWYVRSRPGVMAAFHAAYQTTEDSELVAACASTARLSLWRLSPALRPQTTE